MSYLDRLRPASFVSPLGNVIEFKVDTLLRSGGKKGATQEILDSKESISQDQGNSATIYSVAAYFTGADYDFETDAFYRALEEKYTQDLPGILSHPRWGDIDVFPFSWSQKEELINGAQVGRIDVEFRKTFPKKYPATALNNLNGSLQNIDAMELESQALADGLNVSSISSQASIAGKISSAVGIITNSIREVTATVQAVQDEFDAIQQTIDGIIDDVSGSVIELMTTTQRLIRTPSRIIDSTLNKINNYKNMITDLCNNFFDENETDPVNKKNNAIMMELISGFGVAVTGEAAAFTDYTLRSEVVSAIESINESQDTFNTFFQDARTDGDVSNEFSGNHNFYSLLLNSNSGINNVLLNQAFDLKAEKKFILKNNNDIISLCYQNYNNVQDETLDFFINTNNFTGEEFIELPTGREIVVYG